MAQVAHLLAQALHGACDGARLLVEGDGIAAELHDNQSSIGLPIECRQLRAVDVGEYGACAAAHGDVIHANPFLRLKGYGIDLTVAYKCKVAGGGAIRQRKDGGGGVYEGLPIYIAAEIAFCP